MRYPTSARVWKPHAYIRSGRVSPENDLENWQMLHHLEHYNLDDGEPSGRWEVHVGLSEVRARTTRDSA